MIGVDLFLRLVYNNSVKTNTERNTMIYQIKPRGIIEFFVAFILMFSIPWSIPFLFFFKRSRAPVQRVALPPSRLWWAKFWMILSMGLWWFWLRYFAERCTNCGCVWYRDLESSTEVDRVTEPYTYYETVKVKHYSNSPNRPREVLPHTESEMQVEKTGYHTLSIRDNVYRCVNCGHSHEIREKV
jgi:hypothetical protein